MVRGVSLVLPRKPVFDLEVSGIVERTDSLDLVAIFIVIIVIFRSVTFAQIPLARAPVQRAELDEIGFGEGKLSCLGSVHVVLGPRLLLRLERRAHFVLGLLALVFVITIGLDVDIVVLSSELY